MTRNDTHAILYANNPDFKAGWDDGVRFAERGLPCEWDGNSGNIYGDAFHAAYNATDKPAPKSDVPDWALGLEDESNLFGFDPLGDD